MDTDENLDLHESKTKTFEEKRFDGQKVDGQLSDMVNKYLQEETRPIIQSSRPSSSIYRARPSSASSSSKYKQSNRQIKFNLATDKARSSSTSSAAAKESQSLITSMASRLSRLEKSQVEMRQQLVDGEKMILKLRQENHVLKMRCDEMSNDNNNDSAFNELQKENKTLRLQISEMEAFLNDYGLVWVGNDTDDSMLLHSPSPQPVKHNFNLPLLVEKLKELNTIAGENDAQVTSLHNKVHTLAYRKKVPLGVYKEGLLIKKGPLRPYDHPKCKSFIQDVLDGFFPKEFETEFPDGVIFEIDDMCHQFYSERFLPFSGQGQSIDELGNVHSLASLGGSSLYLGSKEFLSSLPANMVHQGNVIQVRSNIEAMLKGDSQEERPDIVLCNTSILEDMSNVHEQGAKAVTPRDVTTIRVKSDSGAQTLIMKLTASNTIQDIRTVIDQYRVSVNDKYEIRTAFPNRAYDDLSMTLETAGLVPNATLMIKSQNMKK